MTVTLPTASYWLTYLHPDLGRLAQPLQGWFYTISPQGDLSISLLGLIILGLFIGLLTGSFGVGSGFLMAPFLNLLGNIPYNVAVGSDLTHMVGSATLANLRQRALGYVDYKLGFFLFVGSVIGVECGVQLLQVLKNAGEIPFLGHQLGWLQLIMTVIYVLLLGWIGIALYRETRASRKLAEAAVTQEPPALLESSRLQTLNLPPMVSLPVSGVESISLWLILGVGWVSGLLTGLLGVSGAFIRMPALIYVLGVPTVVSLGTNLFELLILALYGAFSHSMKGNVDLVLVIILLITTTIGNQLGIQFQRYLVGPRSLKLYILILFATVLLMIVKLVM